MAKSLESPLTITRRENRQRPYRHLLHLTSQVEFDSPFSDDGLNSRHLAAQPNATVKQSVETIPSILDEDPSQLWRVAPPGGEPSNAMEGSELLALLSSSKINANVYVWRTDWAEWKPVANVFPDFFGK